MRKISKNERQSRHCQDQDNRIIQQTPLPVRASGLSGLTGFQSSGRHGDIFRFRSLIYVTDPAYSALSWAPHRRSAILYALSTKRSKLGTMKQYCGT